MKAAFLDRDGTIVRDYPDEIWCTIESPEFLEESLDALRLLKKKGYAIVIIKNQYGIGEGFITQDDYERFSEKMMRKIADTRVEVLIAMFPDGMHLCSEPIGTCNSHTHILGFMCRP